MAEMHGMGRSDRPPSGGGGWGGGVWLQSDESGPIPVYDVHVH